MKIARDKETRRSQKRHTTTIDDSDDAKDRNKEGKRSALEIRNTEKLYWRIYVTVFYAKIVRVTYSSEYQFCSLSQLANLASTLRLF